MFIVQPPVVDCPMTLRNAILSAENSTMNKRSSANVRALVTRSSGGSALQWESPPWVFPTKTEKFVPVPVAGPARGRGTELVLAQRRARLAQFVEKMVGAQSTSSPVFKTCLQLHRKQTNKCKTFHSVMSCVLRFKVMLDTVTQCQAFNASGS